MEFVNKTKRLYAPSNCDEKGKFAVVLVQGGSKGELKRARKGQDGWPGGQNSRALHLQQP